MPVKSTRTFLLFLALSCSSYRYCHCLACMQEDAENCSSGPYYLAGQQCEWRPQPAADSACRGAHQCSVMLMRLMPYCPVCRMMQRTLLVAFGALLASSAYGARSLQQTAPASAPTADLISAGLTMIQNDPNGTATALANRALHRLHMPSATHAIPACKKGISPQC